MSTKETLDRLSCFNDWKEICEGLDAAANNASSTDSYYIKEAILHIEGIQSISDELAAHIKQLESELEELKRLNEWVSVEDRLPSDDEPSQYYLCEYGNSDPCFFRIVFYAVKNRKGGGYFFTADRDDITHWKQITPPQLKEGE